MALFCCLARPASTALCTPNNPVKFSTWLAFACLCLLSGSGWLLAEWRPETLPGLLPVALRSGLLACIFWALDRGTNRSCRHRLPTGTQLRLFASSVLVAALPTVLVARAGEYLSPWTETLVFALTPALVVFFASQAAAAFGAQESPLRLLAPALAGVAGAALLLPFNLPSSGTAQAWLMALLVTAAASAWAAIHLHRQLTGVPVLRAATIFSASIVLLSAPLSFAQARSSSSWSAPALQLELLHSLLLEAPVTLLTVWLLRELSPVAFSSRYLLGIAITILEGYLLLRPGASWTTGLGLLLLFSSGALLLVAGSRQEVS